MIIPNGYIVFRKSAAGGIGSDGYPTAGSEEWSDEIACQVLPNVNLRTRSMGEAAITHAYTILIDRMELPGEVVKLHYEGKEIGQFSIRSYEHLDAVCQTQITL
jgi:hypothetical protein